MGKPVAGDVVVLPFPQTNLQTDKRRFALVIASLPGDDLILCQDLRFANLPDPPKIYVTSSPSIF